MSLIDKVVSAVTPSETNEERADARATARAIASPGDWFSLILDHHVEVEVAFASTETAPAGPPRTAALKKLGIALTGHAIAEESVIYPALGDAGEKGHATTGYNEQAEVKMQMAHLEKLDPSSQEFLDKLEEIRLAVAHHVYEEEANWYPELKKKAPPDEQAKLTARYAEEFDRYVGQGA